MKKVKKFMKIHNTLFGGLILLNLLLASLTPAQHSDPAKQEEHHALQQLLDPAEATHVATANGQWSDPGTWSGGVPGVGARVHVPSGRTVTYDVAPASAPNLDWVRVDGALHWAVDQDTELRIDTLVATMNSEVKIGDATTPVQGGSSARIVILDNGPIDTGWDWHQLSRGIVTHGRVRMHGESKLTFTQLDADVSAGAAQVTLRDAVDWAPGDQLVVTGTELLEPRVHVPGETWVTEDEEVTIASVSGDGKTVTLTQPLEYAHTGRGNDLLGRPMQAYVGNFTRNILIETENAASLPANQRGHVMFMHHDDVDVRYVRFQELGRTDKSQPLDDFLQETTGFRASPRVLDGNGDTQPGARTNVRGRYALHFHRTGATNPEGTPAKAVGCAVWGSPGWGIVHHDSHADLLDNVTYNIMGSHFVSETGNEIGSWENNLAIKTPDGEVGSGKGGGNNHDVGFTGDGFWFQGRLIHVRFNAAVGMRGAGFKYFTRGVDQIHPVREALDLPVTTRYAGTIGEDNPHIQEFLDNVSSVCIAGFSVIKQNPNQGHDARSVIDGLTAWEVKHGTSVEYTGKYTFKDVTLINFDDSKSSQDAFNFGNTMFDMVFVNCRVQDFARVLDWNGKDTLGQLPDYGFKFIDLQRVNTPDIYHIALNKSAGVTDVNDHVEVLTSADLTPGTLELSLDTGINLDLRQGTVLIEGTKTDSIGTTPFLGGHDGRNDPTFSLSRVQTRAEEDGYWTEEGDPSTAIVTVEELIEDRASGDRLILEIPVRLEVTDIPAGAAYFGEWATGGVELLAENFDDGNIDGWTQWDKNQPASWSVQGGVLKQSSNRPDSLLYWTGSDPSAWQDYQFTVSLMSGDNDGIGVAFYLQDDQNYYRFVMNRQKNERRLEKVVNGVVTDLAASVNGQYQEDTWYLVTVEITDMSITVTLDDGTNTETVFNAVPHAEFNAGSIGLFQRYNNNCSFDDVSVIAN